MHASTWLCNWYSKNTGVTATCQEQRCIITYWTGDSVRCAHTSDGWVLTLKWQPSQAHRVLFSSFKTTILISRCGRQEQLLQCRKDLYATCQGLSALAHGSPSHRGWHPKDLDMSPSFMGTAKNLYLISGFSLSKPLAATGLQETKIF